MGTGKSLQALVTIAMTHALIKGQSKCGTKIVKQEFTSRSLIVCPSTLVGHWAAEIDKYFPPQSLFTCLGLLGSCSERMELWRNKPNSINIVITSYSVLRSDIDYLEKENWCYCVLDEGHLLKNPNTGAFFREILLHKSILQLILIFTFQQRHVHLSG
jgi:TATA-binding protein-associated factor